MQRSWAKQHTAACGRWRCAAEVKKIQSIRHGSGWDDNIFEGEAPALGAGPWQNTVENEKARKPFVYAGFRPFNKTQNSVDFAFDHKFVSLLRKNRKNRIISGCGAAGSAGGLGPSGRRFDPCHSDQKGSGINVPEPFLNIWGLTETVCPRSVCSSKQFGICLFEQFTD